MSDFKRNYIMVHGIKSELDNHQIRSLLKKEFSQFGHITKLYVEESLKFAKVYYESLEFCDNAVIGMRRNEFGWKVSHPTENDFSNQNSRNQSDFSSRGSDYSTEGNYRNNFKNMEGEYPEGDFIENHDYCNVHGHPLVVYQGDAGDIYVNYKDIKKTGFALFRRDTFDLISLDKRQITKEFELHLLTEMKNYILKNYVMKNRDTCIDEEQILQTIARCKERLLNNTTESRNDNTPIMRTIHQSSKTETFYGEDNTRESSYMRSEGPPRSRPPKTPAASFLSSNQLTENRTNNDYNRNVNGEGFHKTRFNRDNLSNNGNESRVIDFKSDSSRDNFSRGDSHRNNQYKNNNARGVDFNRGDVSKTNSNRDNFSKGDAYRNNQYRNNGSRGADFNKGEMVHNNFNKENCNRGDSNRNNQIRSNGAIRKEFPQANKNNETSKPRIPEPTIARDKMEVGNTYNVRISYCEPEKDNICWVQKSESLDIVDNLLLEIAELEPDADIATNLIDGQYGLGEFEGVWCRAVVVNANEKLVHFIDYGNQCVADSIKVFPGKAKDTPALANRLVISHNSRILKDNDDLVVKIKHEYDDGTLLADLLEPEEAGIKTEEKVLEVPRSTQIEVKEVTKPDTPQEKVVPQPEESKVYHLSTEILSTLKEGDKIMFVDIIGNKLGVKTKQCVDKCKELIAYIRELDKTALRLTNVSQGQLVLCSKEGFTGLCRAIVTEIKQNVVKVKYVDYAGEDSLLVKSLRNVDEYLAKQPKALLFTPDLQYLEDLTVVGLNFITQLIGKKEKGDVVITDDGIDFQLASNKLLSEVLLEKSGIENKNIETPQATSSKLPPIVESKKCVPKENKKSPPPETPSTSQSYEKISYDDMAWITLKPGEYDFICYYIKDASEITLVSTLEEHVKFMEQVGVLEDPDNKPYNPEIFEMCLVYFVEDNEEGFWYRGVVLDVSKDDYLVLVVDFGNETTVKCDKLRRFPSHLRKVPILGLTCTLEGVPVTSDVTAKLKELIQPNDNIKAVIKSFEQETLKYTIDIPDVRKELKDSLK